MKIGPAITKCLRDIVSAINKRDDDLKEMQLSLENGQAAISGKLDALLSHAGIAYSETEQLRMDFNQHLSDKTKHATGN